MSIDIITMILHDQSVDISAEIEKQNEALRNMGGGNKQAIYTEPLIRREDSYRYFRQNERQAIFSKLFYFTLGCDILIFKIQLTAYNCQAIIPY